MIKQFLGLAIAISTMSSCAVLYTPAAEPTPFMREKDGIAVNGNIGTNGSGIFVNGNVTKPISDVVCINASGALGVAPIKNWPDNPFKNDKKKQSNLAVNLGINTTRYTKYPLMLWIGGQVGKSADNYAGVPFAPGNSRDSVVVVDAASGFPTRYEKMNGSYLGFKIGLTHVLLSNYDNNFKKREKKRTKLEIMGSPYINLLRYNYANAFTFKTKYNELIGYSISANISRKKWTVGIKADAMQSLLGLTSAARKIPLDVYHPGFSEVPLVVPSISYTRFFRGKYSR